MEQREYLYLIVFTSSLAYMLISNKKETSPHICILLLLLHPYLVKISKATTSSTLLADGRSPLCHHGAIVGTRIVANILPEDSLHALTDIIFSSKTRSLRVYQIAYIIVISVIDRA